MGKVLNSMYYFGNSKVGFGNIKRINQVGGFTGLLDDYPGAAAAYSIRLLRSDYSGALVRIRRSSDNTEKDFYPDSNNELSLSSEDGVSTSLSSWIGANDGFIVTWYDQSTGVSYNATQSSAANQPQIISSGSLITANSKATIDFSIASGARLVNSAFATTGANTSFLAAKQDTLGSSASTFFDSYNNVAHLHRNFAANAMNLNAGTSLTSSPPNLSTTSLQLNYVLKNGASSELAINNNPSDTGNAGNNNFSGLSIGNIRGNPSPIAGGYNLRGKMSELIIYDSNKSTDRSGLQGDQNTHFIIY